MQRAASRAFKEHVARRGGKRRGGSARRGAVPLVIATVRLRSSSEGCSSFSPCARLAPRVPALLGRRSCVGIGALPDRRTPRSCLGTLIVQAPARGAGARRPGEEEAERWEAFRRYLTDFPRLQEAPPATLALWERYLVYGIAFGIAERVLQAAQLHDARGARTRRARSTGSRHGGDLGSGATSLSIGDLASGFGSALAAAELGIR